MRPVKSLSMKITISILTAVLLIFAAIFIYNYRLSRDLLLDNVQENPAQILQFMMSEEDRRATFSGRDW